MELGSRPKSSSISPTVEVNESRYAKNVDEVSDYLRQNLSPYENFTFALKSPDVKRQYPSLLNKFMTFLALQGNI
ncbi:MAG: hypothetical protein L0H53_08265 [Candidatus Nitrosocosmicus sp.]|nr:hypothetical protein [Candidatus Nitrosocosmicus sp.]